ncbi:hypothetical protein Y032_0116g545 [Ancylostoma ceylanicum]|uniref:Uncharacterized protein n=1 Tax=Ancylostoma ceylanicum TaxID=53326 RepID=A0A016TC80_9BILA|nr:hypothetical protein Y032_0116g545 [Ancylostoma ceylanicum]
MLARFHATQPGASLAFLLTLIGLLLLLQMGSMSFYRVMMTEMKWRKTVSAELRPLICAASGRGFLCKTRLPGGIPD